MKSKARRNLLLALLFGLITAALLGRHLLQLQTAGTEGTVPVVVAARAIAAGTELTNEMVQVVQWPESARFPGLIGSKGEAVGRQTGTALEPGQPLVTGQTLPLEHVGHGGRVPLGMRLITILIDEENAIGYRLRPDDRVDVLAVYSDEQGTHAELLLQAIQVYGVGKAQTQGKTADPASITLLVKPDQAQTVSVLAKQKAIRLVMRATGDDEISRLTKLTRPAVK